MLGVRCDMDIFKLTARAQSIYREVYEYTNQCGFRTNLNTSDAVIVFLDNVYSSLDNKQRTIAVYLNFSMTFDKVNHNIFVMILMSKLLRNGIRGSSSSSMTDHWIHFQQNTVIRLFVHSWIAQDIDNCYQFTRIFGGSSAQCLFKLFLKEFTDLLLTTSFRRHSRW